MLRNALCPWSLLLCFGVAAATVSCGDDSPADGSGDVGVELGDQGEVGLDVPSDLTDADDPGVDGSDGALGDTLADRDASADASADAADDIAADLPNDLNIDGGDLAGTSLEGIAVVWDQPLTLCGAPDAVTLDAALEQKVVVTLEPALRRGLTAADLNAARLSGAHVERSPFAADQWDLSGEAISSRLTAFEVSGPSNRTRLQATIVHELGDAGRLFERLDVTREAPAADAVRYEPPFGDARFRYGHDELTETVRLVSCAGDDSLEEAVDVVVVETENRSMTLFRFYRTSPPLSVEEPAFEWWATRIVESDQFFFFGDPEEIDYWAMTRAVDATGSESIQVDKTRSATAYYTVFGPFERDATLPSSAEIAEIRMEDLGGDATTASIRVLDPEDAGYSVEDASPNGPFRRVDRAHLLRAPEADCAGADVFALGEGSYELQLIACPLGSPPGFDLTALVPVSFQADASVVGDTLTGDAISSVTVDDRPGYRVAWDTFEVDITFDSVNDYYFLTIRDGDETLVEQLSFQHDLSVRLAMSQQLVGESEEDGVTALIERRWAGQGVGISSIFAPTRFELGFDDAVHRVTALDRFDYTNTHHNWNDSLAADTDDLRLFWSYTFFPGPEAHTVRAETLGGDPVLEATEISVTIETP